MPTVAETTKKPIDKAKEDYFKGKITAADYLKEIEVNSGNDKTLRESEKRFKKIIEESKVIFG